MAIAAALDGATPEGRRGTRRHGSAALRDWVIRFNERPDGLINKSSPGAPGKLTGEHKALLAGLVEDSPIPAMDGVVRWRACDLIMRLRREFGISVSDDTVYRALKDLGFSQSERRAEGPTSRMPRPWSSKKLPARVADVRTKLAPGTPIEVWCQDDAGRPEDKLTYRWARKGSRPRAIHDQRTQSTYLFGAVCPERGAGAALVLPACNSEAMQLHLDEIATKVTYAPGAHAIVLLIKPAGMAPRRSRSRATSL